jgi:hypothetical protein
MVQYNGLAKKDEGGNSSFRHTSFPPSFLLFIYKLRSYACMYELRWFFDIISEP